MWFILSYLAVVTIGTAAIVAATSDRYRHYFPWLVQDEPEERT